MFSSIALAVIFLIFVSPLYSQDEHWSEPIFIETAIQHYFVPEIFTGLIKPNIGFRAAMGYEYWRFRLALEGGYTNIPGTNSGMLGFAFIPLVFKLGYVQPIYREFGLQPDLGAGILFSNTAHYKDAINMLLKNEQKSIVKSPLTRARLYGTYTLPWNYLRLYAGGGADIIFEKRGRITFYAVEAGISFKFFSLMKKTDTSAKSGIVFASVPENIIVKEGTQGKTVRLLNAVYFEADTAVLIESYRPILDEAGERLKANPNLTIILRGYSAPFGTAEGRLAVSRNRARYCSDYLVRKYKVDGSRIKIEFYGAEKEPAFAGANWESYRCVELILQ